MLCECCWLRKGNEQAWAGEEQLPPLFCPASHSTPPYPITPWAVSLTTSPALSRQSVKPCGLNRATCCPQLLPHHLIAPVRCCSLWVLSQLLLVEGSHEQEECVLCMCHRQS